MIMTEYIEFDPEEHEGEELYEFVCKDVEEGRTIVVLQPADVDFETAKETPWFYLVKVGEEEKQAVAKLKVSKEDPYVHKDGETKEEYEERLSKLPKPVFGTKRSDVWFHIDELYED